LSTHHRQALNDPGCPIDRQTDQLLFDKSVS
jgi:hypothetical protein